MSNKSLEELLKSPLAIASDGWTCEKIVQAIRKDPHQSRLSICPLIVKHPTTNKMGVLGEFVEEVLGEGRVMVEADDGLVFIARLKNSTLGVVFVPLGMLKNSDQGISMEA